MIGAKAHFMCLVSLLILLSSLQFAVASSAPDFTLADIDGNTFSLSDFRGKVVMLDFFATWCIPCIDQIPHMQSLQSQFGQELVIISISVDPITDTVEKLEAFRGGHQITWIVARDTIEVFGTYNVTAVPTTYVIDKDGNVTSRHVGLTEESVFETELNSLIPEYQSTFFLLLLVVTTLMAVSLKNGRVGSKSKPS